MNDLSNPIKPWENEIWTVEPIFKGKTVFVLASGPSMTQVDADKCKGHPVIVINSTCTLAPWADVLYFTDSGWYANRRDLVKNWPGLVVCMSRLAKREIPEKVKRIRGRGSPGFAPRFPAMGEEEIQQGRTSGHTGVALAMAMGAVRVVLLGFDMQMVNGREHHHDEYNPKDRDLNIYKNEFQSGFDGWNAPALALGVQIINCTQGSAVKEFPFMSLDAVLARCA